MDNEQFLPNVMRGGKQSNAMRDEFMKVTHTAAPEFGVMYRYFHSPATFPIAYVQEKECAKQYVQQG